MMFPQSLIEVGADILPELDLVTIPLASCSLGLINNGMKKTVPIPWGGLSVSHSGGFNHSLQSSMMLQYCFRRSDRSRDCEFHIFKKILCQKLVDEKRCSAFSSMNLPNHQSDSHVIGTNGFDDPSS